MAWYTTTEIDRIIKRQLKEMEGEMRRQRIRQACVVFTPVLLIVVFGTALLVLIVK